MPDRAIPRNLRNRGRTRADSGERYSDFENHSRPRFRRGKRSDYGLDFNPKFLVVYSGVLTVAFAVTLSSGFVAGGKKAQFDEIDAHRINIVEPDETPRMVISDKAEFPGSFVMGKEYPRPDRTSAGMLFLNNEDTENGGLIFEGMKDEKGQIHTYGHLSFDQYEQDQTFTIDASENAGEKDSQLAIWDRPDYSIAGVLSLPPDQWRQAMEARPRPHERIYLGRGDDKSAVLRLKDISGRDRIVIEVRPDGSPVIQFLDENGKVVGEFPQRKN